MLKTLGQDVDAKLQKLAEEYQLHLNQGLIQKRSELGGFARGAGFTFGKSERSSKMKLQDDERDNQKREAGIGQDENRRTEEFHETVHNAFEDIPEAGENPEDDAPPEAIGNQALPGSSPEASGEEAVEEEKPQGNAFDGEVEVMGKEARKRAAAAQAAMKRALGKSKAENVANLENPGVGMEKKSKAEEEAAKAALAKNVGPLAMALGLQGESTVIHWLGFEDSFWFKT